ncbi:dimethylaniline monooxygenase 2 [Colletotrichum scovillei]|uniref:Dimethylaniline monooxygenase 2 n=1 Tax=Colletotrichum scovillei TaxID=1209932 RepID=A0A9P7QSA2_9PEZI|nr:dimethylaniline monooxygenase 2 [Colletotrichum scovillei]KAF4781481.1 dimethylaniline monooxygenase 2 [Colletotrichum scovillei]KAG7039114.1 dimethylaniline monooxygenase 2 [Colletotrichum scovillei]KAG7041294.1 dimethylaniline monooxygenase 2 [Colletotrichum scovillei]KAG7061324.1 dimethylaniline monooxygenase 2 [Colletotrichum scovillei]
MDKDNATTVAVIGAGSTGLSMLKTLREDGFDATLFERRSRVGGLWSYTDDKSMTTALPSTNAIISKYTCGFTDFPMPDKYGPFLSQGDFEEYMESYAENFGLYKHIVFNSTVKQVIRNGDGTKWKVEMVRSGSQEVKEFDKVVLCHGYQTQPRMPTFEGQELYQGQLIHSQQFRNPENYKDQKVVLVGLSATMSDLLTILVDQASETFVSHRNGAMIIGRWRNGLPTDLLINRARRQMSYFLQRNFPNQVNKLVKLATGLLMRQHGKIDPAWRLLENVAPLSLHLAGCMDTTLELLREGKVSSLYGIKRFLGGKKIEFTDGTVLDDVDSVVCCTGYTADFSLVPFVETSKPKADAAGHPYGGESIARLYMNLFPPAHADSIAILAYSTYGKNNGFSFSDVTSMAISNIWRGVSADMIPSRPKMERAIDRHQEWVAGRWHQENRSEPGAVKQWEFQGFLHQAAGTGMENLGWGWRGWVTWFKDPYMVYLINHGVETAHAFRYFETGKRKTWDGAREAIIHMNKLVKQLKSAKR